MTIPGPWCVRERNKMMGICLRMDFLEYRSPPYQKVGDTVFEKSNIHVL